MSSTFGVVLAITSLTIAVLISTPPVSARTGGSPVWTVGEEWTYRGYYLDPGVRWDFTVAVKVAALSNNSALVEANHTFSSGWMLQRTLFRWPSLGVVCSNATFSNGRRSDLCYTPPLEWLNFTLQAGKAWNVSTSPGGLEVWGYRYAVLPETSVETPAGTTSAFPVTQTAMGIPMITVKNVLPGQGTARTYFSGDVGNLVFYEAFDQGGAKVAEATLTSPALPRRANPALPVFITVGAIAVAIAAVVGLGLFVALRRRPRPPPRPPVTL